MNRLCEFEGCHRKHDAKGLCKSHYNQVANGGLLSPIGSFPKRRLSRVDSIEEFFWARVDKTSQCWNWTGASAIGYGRIKYQGEVILAHRFSWGLANGTIPEGASIDHLCHNRSCVNPQHLRAATHAQNMQNLRNTRANNRSGARNVHWSEPKRKWIVRVGANGKKHHGGEFHNIEDATLAAAELRRQLHT